MPNKKVSVIMPVYNCENTIIQAVKSIINQTYTNWELIICDDCSTDNTRQIALEFHEKYPTKIVVIKNTCNSKLSFSLNHCLQYASGEFIARMDGDDVSHPERLERQVAFLKNNSDIHLVGTAMQIFDGMKVTGIRKYKSNVCKYDLAVNPCFAHATILTYKYVYDALKGYTVSKRTERGQDYDLWFRFFAQGFKGANIDDALYIVTEDAATYKRRKFKYRLYTVITMLKGYKMLGYPLWYYPFVLKQLLCGLIPECMMRCYRLKVRSL